MSRTGSRFTRDCVAKAGDRQARQADVGLSRSYFLRWAGSFVSVRPADQQVTFEEIQAAAERLAA